MRALLAGAALLVSCAHFQPGTRATSDVSCGRVGTVEVALRSGLASPGLTCDQALALVQDASPADVTGPWTLIFTGGFTGLSVDRNCRAYSPLGLTYPAQRVIMISSRGPDAIAHELGHASDFDHGRPNRRDGR
jgi:hypothetical protein